MNLLHINTPDGPKPLNIPKADEITMSMLMDLKDHEPLSAEGLQVLTGFDADYFRQMDAGEMMEIADRLEFPDLETETYPKELDGVPVPTDIGAVPWGAIEAIKKKVGTGATVDAMPFCVGFVMCKAVHGKYTEEDAFSLAEKYCDYPAGIIFPLGKFFLTESVKLLNGGKSYLQTRKGPAQEERTQKVDEGQKQPEPIG